MDFISHCFVGRLILIGILKDNLGVNSSGLVFFFRITGSDNLSGMKRPSCINMIRGFVIIFFVCVTIVLMQEVTLSHLILRFSTFKKLAIHKSTLGLMQVGSFVTSFASSIMSGKKV